jgi:copper chaperone CopZ
MQTKILKVVGRNTMHCSGCETTVKFALRQLPGVHKIDANYKTQLIQLTFDPQSVALEQVRQELDWIGYRVEEATNV